MSPQQVHYSVSGEQDGLALVHLQGLIKHSIDHVGVGDLIEKFCRLKSSQPLPSLLRPCWHCHVQVEQDGEEVLGIAGKPELKYEINYIRIDFSPICSTEVLYVTYY